MATPGTLLLVEGVVRPANESDVTKLFDLNMLVLAGGRERTAAEYQALLEAAGFAVASIIPTPAVMGVRRPHRPARSAGSGGGPCRDGARSSHCPHLSLCLPQPVRLAHLAVHRRRGGEVFLGLLALVRAGGRACRVRGCSGRPEGTCRTREPPHGGTVVGLSAPHCRMDRGERPRPEVAGVVPTRANFSSVEGPPPRKLSSRMRQSASDICESPS